MQHVGVLVSGVLSSTALVVVAAAFPMALVTSTGCLEEVPSAGLEEPPQKVATEAKRGQSLTPAGLRRRSTPPGSKQRIEARKRMVDTQIARPRDGRTPVRSRAVLEAMRIVPRHAFVPYFQRQHAYRDAPLPIGHDQTISQPYIVAWMTELLELKRDSRVLEIGTGSGYQAAVLAHLTEHVYSIEIVKALATRARKTLEKQGYTEVKCRQGDGYHGWAEHAPFDAIIVTCAPDDLPQPLWDQLKPGGRIVIPIGGPREVQRLVLVEKTTAGKRREKTLSAVRFVPLTRERGRPLKQEK